MRLGQERERRDREHVTEDAEGDGAAEADGRREEADDAREQRAERAADVVTKARAGPARPRRVELREVGAEAREAARGEEAEREADDEQRRVGAGRDEEVGHERDPRKRSEQREALAAAQTVVDEAR